MIEILDSYDIQKIKLEDALRLSGKIDGIVISISNGKPEMILTESVSGDRLKKWKSGRGQIFLNDIKSFRLKGNDKKWPYFIIKADETPKYIIRFIEDAELESFKNLDLIGGKIKDADFMILKDFTLSDLKSNGSDEYIDLEEDKISISTSYIPLDEEADNSTHSVSLFED